MANETENLQETLKPLYIRASQAEDRLTRLEAALASKTEAGNEELLKKISEIQTKLEDAHANLVVEQGKVNDLKVKNEKQKYRIEHLVRALREADESWKE